MSFQRYFATVLAGVWAAAVIVGYGAGLIGLLGWLDARSVTLIALIGTGVSLVAAVTYFAGAELRLRQRRSW